MHYRTILILGGTSWARDLADILASSGSHDHLFYSLADITEQPILPNCTILKGGFGGPDKLAHWLIQNQALCIDATHPFARDISKNAKQACVIANQLYWRLCPKGFRRTAHDRWHLCSEHNAAQQLMTRRNAHEGRVFLALGARSLAPFRGITPQPIVRVVDQKSAEHATQAIRGAEIIVERGPFELENEISLIKQHQIKWLVMRNSGAKTLRHKITAARMLECQILMIKRPIEKRPSIVQKNGLWRFTNITSILGHIHNLIEKEHLSS